jgi:hypothetical protein
MQTVIVEKKVVAKRCSNLMERGNRGHGYSVDVPIGVCTSSKTEMPVCLKERIRKESAVASFEHQRKMVLRHLANSRYACVLVMALADLSPKEKEHEI